MRTKVNFALSLAMYPFWGTLVFSFCIFLCIVRFILYSFYDLAPAEACCFPQHIFFFILYMQLQASVPDPPCATTRDPTNVSSIFVYYLYFFQTWTRHHVDARCSFFRTRKYILAFIFLTGKGASGALFIQLNSNVQHVEQYPGSLRQREER